MKLIFLGSSFSILWYMRRHKIVRRTYDKDQDTFRHHFLILPCLLLALLINEKFTFMEVRSLFQNVSALRHACTSLQYSTYFPSRYNVVFLGFSHNIYLCKYMRYKVGICVCTLKTVLICIHAPTKKGIMQKPNLHRYAGTAHTSKIFKGTHASTNFAWLRRIYELNYPFI